MEPSRIGYMFLQWLTTHNELELLISHDFQIDTVYVLS
jgi:hypothetical protein